MRPDRLQPRLMEHPLNGAIKQHGMVELGNLPIEPQVYPSDRRVFEMRDLLAQRHTLRRVGQNAIQGIEGKRDNQIVEALFRAARISSCSRAHLYLRALDRESIH